MKAILAIDQGTTSTRAIAFSIQGKKICTSQLEFKQYFPKNGWVEHDIEEIWKTTLQVVKDVIRKCKKKKHQNFNNRNYKSKRNYGCVE